MIVHDIPVMVTMGITETPGVTSHFGDIYVVLGLLSQMPERCLVTLTVSNTNEFIDVLEEMILL